MIPSSQQSVRALRSKRLLLLWLPIAAATACCAAFIDWPKFNEPSTDAMESTTVARTVVPQSQAPVPTKRPFFGRGGDTRLMRSPTPELPVALSEEGKRMVTGMLNVYRCGHSGSKRSLPPVISEPQSTTLDQSLASLPDACYVNAALGRIANPETPADEMSTLFADLLRRPDALKLRMLFVIASIGSHPRSAEALEQLRNLLSTDWEQDWARWEQAVTQFAVREERGVRIASCRSR